MDTIFPKLALLIIISLFIIFNKNARKEFIESIKTNIGIRYIVIPILLYVIFVIVLLISGVRINPPHLLTFGLFVVFILGGIMLYIEGRKKKKTE